MKNRKNNYIDGPDPPLSRLHIIGPEAPYFTDKIGDKTVTTYFEDSDEGREKAVETLLELAALEIYRKKLPEILAGCEMKPEKTGEFKKSKKSKKPWKVRKARKSKKGK